MRTPKRNAKLGSWHRQLHWPDRRSKACFAPFPGEPQTTAAISRTCCLTWSFYSVVWLSTSFRTCPHWSSRAAVILLSSATGASRWSLTTLLSTFKLDLEDRYSIQMPWTGEDGCSGTLAITSEPKRSHVALVGLLSEAAVFRQLFRQANCFVSSDPLFELIQQYGQPPFAYVINASTAFRSLVAVSSYGTHALLPMNQGEASQVCKLLLQRGQGTDLDQTETPRFPSPFSLVESEVDRDALKSLTRPLTSSHDTTCCIARQTAWRLCAQLVSAPKEA